METKAIFKKENYIIVVQNILYSGQFVYTFCLLL